MSAPPTLANTRRVLLQLLAVWLIDAAAIGYELTQELPRSLLNLVWIVGIPFLIGFLSSTGTWRLAMGSALIMWSFVSIMLCDMLAHLLLNTCLSG